MAPTAQRSFNTHTTYDSLTRKYTIVAADYPILGVDSLWESTINDGVNETKPVTANLLLAHPDASPNNPGSIAISRILTGPSQRTFAIFTDGSIHEIDVKAAKYSKLGNLFEKTSLTNGVVTDAHVVDGLTLKSFVSDESKNVYLIKTEITDSGITISAPVPIKASWRSFNWEHETPIAAHMISMHDGMEPKLVVVLAGDFDQINWIDEDTGVMDPLVSNLYDFSTGVSPIFECTLSTKDCDFWRTSAYDAEKRMLYFQAHAVDSEDIHSTTILQMGFTQNKVTKLWYPYVNQAIWPMNFGYSGYQFVSLK